MTEMDFQTRIRSIAVTLKYPPTPDIAGSIMPRLRPAPPPRRISKTLAWSMVTILILLSSLMLIPPARAAILEFIQIGIVRIFPRPTEPPVEAPITAVPPPLAPETATPQLEFSTLLIDLREIAGETTFAGAQRIVPYPILLPAYPPDLGEPDHIFVQDADGSMTILVWLNPEDSSEVLISLHIIPEGSWAIHKSEPVVIQETLVNGQRALWAVGPYPLLLSNGDMDITRLIEGHVLIWADGAITYRLESNLSLEQAVRVAESLQSVP